MPDGSMSLSALAAIEAVVRTYLDGLYEGDGEKIQQAFHPVSHLYSVAKDGTAARQKPSEMGFTREDRILAIDMAGEDAACAKVNCAIPPRHFTDYLLLLKTAEGWKIVSKSFHTDVR